MKFPYFYRESDALDHVAIVSAVIEEAHDNKVAKKVEMNLVKVKQLAMMVAKRVATQTEDADAFSDEISVNASRVTVKMRKAMATGMAMATRKMERMAMEMLVGHEIVALDHAIDQTKIEAVIK